MNRERQCRKQQSVLNGVVAGVIGGLVASWVMEQFQALWATASAALENSRRGQKLAAVQEKQEQQAAESEGQQSQSEQDQEPATVKAAELVVHRVLNRELADSERHLAGEAMHYAMGATSGAIYGALSEVNPAVTIGAGLPFGVAVWLFADEVAVPALGLSKGPMEYPLSTHAYALASHLVYGATTELVRSGVRNTLSNGSAN